MKVSILAELKDGPFGGGNQFLKALKKYFVEKEIYEYNPENADVIIFNSFPFREEYRFKQAYKFKKKKKILIHRVDGPIFKTRNRDFEIDKVLYYFNEFYADGTIFQSNWSKLENYKQGMKKNKNEITILNAPDSNIFNKKDRIDFNRNRKVKIISTSWSSNWNKGFMIYKFLDENLDFSKYEMTFIGNSPIKFKNIRWIKPLKSEDLATQLKKHNIFIIASQNDPCSNSLIEALHCGLPSVVLNDGGHPEIIGNAGVKFNKKYELLEKIEDVVQNYDKYQKNIELLNINEIAEEYYNFSKKIYKDFKNQVYVPKKNTRLQFLKIKYLISTWKIRNIGFFKYIIINILKFIKKILNKIILSISKTNLGIIEKFTIDSYYTNSKHDLNWLFNLKKDVPKFLDKIKGKKRSGFYHYSLSGDYFKEKIKWGLGNSVFFLKIIYTLDLEKEYQREIKEAIKYILSFQRKNGSIYDPLVKILSFPLRIYNATTTMNFANIRNKLNERAETRQSFSALSLYGVKPFFEYKKIPKNKKKIEKYLRKLNWEVPWGAGSHFSHLLFFLHHSKLENKDKLIKYAIDWVDTLQHENDGFWYKGDPPIQQKINGAMKIITGLKAINKVNFQFPKKIIDNILSANNDEQACDNFNIVYVLKYCNELTLNKYRYSEIKDFLYERLAIYRQYYYLEHGGFSFNKNQANQNYYNAYISKGKQEPDIHGTVLFLWGISIIAQTLKINNKLGFKESII